MRRPFYSLADHPSLSSEFKLVARGSYVGYKLFIGCRRRQNPGSMNPDTNIGGNLAAAKEVFHGKTTSHIVNKVQERGRPTGGHQGYTIGEASRPLGVGETAIPRRVSQWGQEQSGITPKFRALTPEQ